MAAPESEGPPESGPVGSVAPPLPEGPFDAGSPPLAAGPASPGGASPGGGGPQVALLPRGVGEVVDTAIALYRRNWKLLVATAAVVVVPVQLLNSFASRNLVSQIGDAFRSMQKGLTPATTGGTGVGSPGGLLALLALPFLTAALATAAASCYMGRPITPGRAWRATMRRFWAVLGLGVLRFMLIGVGFFFFIVPGIFLSIRLLVAPVALMVEGAGPASALERSWRLTSGQWWRTCGVEVLKVVMLLAAYVLIETPIFLLSLVAGPVGWLLLAIGGSLVQVFATPFLVAVTVVIYFDLRIRKEAFDLAVTAQRLQSPQVA
jgi:hypothetical protein